MTKSFTAVKSFRPAQSVVDLRVYVSMQDLSLEDLKPTNKLMIYLLGLAAVERKTNAEGPLSSYWQYAILNKLLDEEFVLFS